MTMATSTRIVFAFVLGLLCHLSGAFQPSATSRRNALQIIASVPTLLYPTVSLAGKIKPDDAFASLVKARKELQTVGETYLPK